MGVVYRAQDPKIGRTLAIKSIRLNELTDPEERERLRERLFREAQSAGILSHPNIVTIYDVLEEDGLAYIFMECVNGMGFDEFLRTSPRPSGAVVMDLLVHIASALDYAHKNGIVHRDIKPANVLIHEGTIAKVCDFGVAKIVSQQMTQAGILMGTPSYMAPEQIEGKTMDGRSDQFALAVMIFDILTGEKPFAGDSLPILLYKICRAEPPSASGINTTLGIWVDPVLRKALSKDPNDRFPTCAAFISELRRALDERPGWMLPGKGFPGEDSTTGSGNSGTQAGSTADAVTSAASVPPTQPSTPTPPPFVRPASNFQPPVQTVNSSTDSTPYSPPASTTASTGPLPLSRAESRSSSPLLFAVPVILVLAAGGYFGYQKLSQPKPAAAEPASNLPPQPGDPPPVTIPATNPDPGPKPVEKPVKPEVPKPGEGSTNPPKPTDPLTKPPTAGGGFKISFSGTPPGVMVTVDGDSSTACKTPCSIPLGKGRHVLTASMDGYRAASKVVEVTGEASIPIDLAESLTVLTIQTTPPGCGIVLNGQERSEKTPAQLRVKPGQYQIVLVSPDGRRESSQVIVRDGLPALFSFTFP